MVGTRMPMIPVVVLSNEDLDPAQKQELRKLVDRNTAWGNGTKESISDSCGPK
jgi:hypothetical protein